MACSSVSKSSPGHGDAIAAKKSESFIKTWYSSLLYVIVCSIQFFLVDIMAYIYIYILVDKWVYTIRSPHPSFDVRQEDAVVGQYSVPRCRPFSPGCLSDLRCEKWGYIPYIALTSALYMVSTPPKKKKVPEMAIDLWCLIIFINWDGRLGQVRAYLATEAWRCNMGDIVIWKKWQVPSSNQTWLDGKNPPLICDVSFPHYPLVI